MLSTEDSQCYLIKMVNAIYWRQLILSVKIKNELITTTFAYVILKNALPLKNLQRKTLICHSYQWWSSHCFEKILRWKKSNVPIS